MHEHSLAAAEQLEATMAELFRLFKEQHVRDMADLQLSSAQGLCLKVIGSSEPLTMGQLADCLALSSAAVTSQVDRLEAQGWVLREPDDKDRRIIRVRLSESGQQVFDDWRAQRCRQLQGVLETLSPAEQDTLITGLGLFAQALGRTLANP